MKTEDLMVGDWVNVFDVPKQIEGIRTFKNGDEMVYYDGDNGNFIENVTPIPLTEEILEKSGFENSEWYGWQIKGPEFTLCFVGDTPHFLLDELFVCNCPYVHTFQHALKLCEIEKKIVL